MDCYHWYNQINVTRLMYYVLIICCIAGEKKQNINKVNSLFSNKFRIVLKTILFEYAVVRS